MACTKLEQIANDARAAALARNNYSIENPYGAQHPDATQQTTAQDPMNRKGRGTGGVLDTSGGGNYTDIYGIPSLPNTGRNAIFNLNEYNPNNPYNPQSCL